MIRTVYQKHPYVVWTHTIEDKKISSIRSQMHYDQFLIVTYLIHGTGRLLVEGSCHEMQSGDILILSTNELHHCHFDDCENHERISIYISPNICGVVSADPTNLCSAFYNRKSGNQNVIPSETVEALNIDILLKSIVKQQNNHLEDDYNLYLTCKIIELMLLLKKAIISVPDDAGKTIQNDLVLQIIMYINSNLKSKLSVSTIANHFFLDKSYICRVFRKFTGLTIGDYIARKRIDNAIELLNCNVPCTDVCFECGFGNYSSFFKAFKSFTGVDPNNYKGNNEKRSQK